MLTDCRPIQLFVVVRHGTRYPDLDQIPNMQKLLMLRDEIISNHREKQSEFKKIYTIF